MSLQDLLEELNRTHVLRWQEDLAYIQYYLEIYFDICYYRNMQVHDTSHPWTQ